MKKITFLILLLTASFSFGQVVLTEDFESSATIPMDWTNNDIAGNGEIWIIEATGDAALLADGNTNIYDAGECAGNYASFDSDAYGDDGNAEDAALESPVFDCTALTQVTLSFNHYFAGNYGGTGNVEVYNGTAWASVATYSGDGYQGGPISIDVSTELAGVSSAQVRFRWAGSWAVAWYVDNITVFQCTVAAPDAASVSSPADGATDVAIQYGAPNSVGPFEWTDAVTGDAADSYNFNLGVTAAGNDIGTIANFGGGDIVYDFLPDTVYYWSVDAVNCGGVTAGPIWSFTTSSCSDAFLPGAASGPTPADGATDVGIQYPDGALNFSWTGASVTDTFILNLGTTNPPTQAFNNFTSGDPLTGLQENTTYYWSIDPVNCVGVSTGSVWSFTTGTLLSIEDESISSFKVYPNPVKDVLNIKTNATIDSVSVMNQLGQVVLELKGSSMENNKVDMSSFSNGLYFLTINAEGKSETVKFIKK